MSFDRCCIRSLVFACVVSFVSIGIGIYFIARVQFGSDNGHNKDLFWEIGLYLIFVPTGIMILITLITSSGILIYLCLEKCRRDSYNQI